MAQNGKHTPLVELQQLRSAAEREGETAKRGEVNEFQLATHQLRRAFCWKTLAVMIKKIYILTTIEISSLR